jgi:sec-independent protein translocase protein TatA
MLMTTRLVGPVMPKIKVLFIMIINLTKLPQFGRAIGSTLKEFKSATEDLDKESHDTPSKESKQYYCSRCCFDSLLGVS